MREPVNFIENETWKPIPAKIPDIFFASDLGRIKRMNESGTEEYLLKPSGKLYKQRVALTFNKDCKVVAAVGRLVLSAFQPVENMLYQPFLIKDENDPNPLRLENLRWCSVNEKYQHKKNLNFTKVVSQITGEEKIKPIAISDNVCNQIIRLYNNGKNQITQEQIAEKFGISQSNVSYIVRGFRRITTTGVTRKKWARFDKKKNYKRVQK